MIIKGANLGEVETEFNRLGSYGSDLDDSMKKQILYIDNMYYSLLCEKDNVIVNDIPTDSNGNVVIIPGMLNHRCAKGMDNLRNISKYGVLASEWFGIFESEMEGRFCTFISRMKGEDYNGRGSLSEDNHSRLNIGNDILLFFDEDNPVMKYLLHLDYFEYENIKQKNKDKLKEIYSEEEIEMFDKLIEPLSPAGMNMRKDYESKTNYWSAIPGGIPSYLINGICIKNNKFTIEEINELGSLFPNATIFKGDLEIVAMPFNKKEENNKTL